MQHLGDIPKLCVLIAMMPSHVQHARLVFPFYRGLCNLLQEFEQAGRRNLLELC